MFSSVVSLLERLESRPSLRTLFVLVLLVTAILVGGAGYENYTAYYRLQRLTSTAELLETLQRIEQGGLADPALVHAHSVLTEALSQALPEPSGAMLVAPTPQVGARETLWKFLAGGALWWMAALYVLVRVLRGQEKSRYAWMGIFLFGVLFGAVGAALPSWYWPWFNFLLYPFVHFSLVLLAVAAFGMGQGSPPEEKSPGKRRRS